MVVAQSWPSSLISVLALDLPLLASYFPIKLHEYFKFSKHRVAQWFSTRDFCALMQEGNAVYLLSGTSEFLKRVLDLMRGSQRVIVTVEWTRRSASRPAIQRALKSGHDLLAAFNFLPLVVADSTYGGVTDSRYIIGFGHELGTSITPTIERGLPRMLRYVLDGGTEGRFPSVLKSFLPILDNPARAVLLHDGVVRPQGLFPSCSPDMNIFAPSYKLKSFGVIWGLTMPE